MALTTAAANRVATSWATPPGLTALRQATTSERATATRAIADAPVRFESNVGQAGNGFDFIARGTGYSMFLQSSGVMTTVDSKQGTATIGMTLAGSHADARPRTGDPAGPVINYYFGLDRSQWHTGVRTFDRVRYSGVYNGIDVEYYGHSGKLEYDFLVAPGADPTRIAMVFDGMKAVCIDDAGSLVLETSSGEIRHARPYVYQRLAEGSKREVSASFSIRDGRVGFEVAPYDRDRELVIDPAVVMTYGDIPVTDYTAVDGGGNMYIAGLSYLNGFPPTNAANLNTVNIWVMKVKPSGIVDYTTFIGGTDRDEPRSIALDANGNAYVAGVTTSFDFPTTNGGVAQRAQTTTPSGFAASWDLCLFKLNSTGGLVYSTLLGGEGPDGVYTGSYPPPGDPNVSSIAVDATGYAYVAGWSASYGLPGTVDTRIGGSSANGSGYVAKIAVDGSSVLWLTLLGDAVTAVCVDDLAAVYITGASYSGLPATSGALQRTSAGGEDAYVAKLDQAGALVYLTYVGGSRNDVPASVAVDSDHNVYVVGDTGSTDFPITPNAVAKLPVMDSHLISGFLVKLDPTLSTLLYSSYFSSGRDVVAQGNSVTALGYGRGYTGAGWQAYPLLNDFGYGGCGQAVVARFNSSMQPEYSICFPVTLNGRRLASAGSDVWVPLARGLRRVTPVGTTTLILHDFTPSGTSGNYPAGREFGVFLELGYFAYPGTEVLFGGVPAVVDKFASVQDWKGYAPLLPAGSYDVVVKTPGLTPVTLPQAWTVAAGNTGVNGVAPTTIPAYKTSTITITGTGFPPGAGVLSQKLVSLTSFRVDSQTIVAMIPPGTPGNSLSVTVPRGPTDGIPVPTVTVEGPYVTLAAGTAGSVAGGSATNVLIVRGNVDDSTSVLIDGITAPPNGARYSCGTFDWCRGFLAPPHPAGTVDVVVGTPSGSATFPSAYRYVQTISVTDVQPRTGPSDGGTAITITGSGFAAGARVFLDDAEATYVAVPSSTTITATTPRHRAGEAKLVVVNADGASTTFGVYGGQIFKYGGLQVSSISPSQGPSAGGATVTINGSGFDATCVVAFDGIAGTVTQTSATALTVTTPVHAAGIADVRVSNSAGQNANLYGSYMFQDPAPTITAITPAIGVSTGGTAVTITGTGFSPGARVTVAGLMLQNMVITPTSITGTTPPQMPGYFPGLFDVIVTNPDGRSATTKFTYVVAPTVSSITPSAGPESGGTAVTIYGSNFVSDSVVTFDGLPATGVTVSSSSIQATTPAHVAGDVSVRITSASIGSNLTIGFRYLPPPPTITSFTPTIAFMSTPIVITGTNFLFVSSVKFSNNIAATFTVDSPTQITATVPPNAVSGPITVTTQAGSATSSATFTMDTTGPRVDSFAPASGIAGTSVVITGIRFTGATLVQFGGVAAASFTVDSDTQITAVVPATAVSGPITVATTVAAGTSGAQFTAAPRFASPAFAPTSAAVGSTTSIYGFNFQGATEVRFNGVPAVTFTVNSGTSITATVPAGASTGPITVVTPVSSITTTTSFGVAPAITSFTPAGGGAGTVVTITGTNFTGATAVRFGGIAASSFTVVDDMTITAVVAAGTSTGPIVVITPGGTGTSAISFLGGAKITSFTPAKGIVGTAVTITGQYFTGATGVAFNGTPATAFTVVSDTTITTTVPAGATTGPISITTPVATTSSPTNFYMPITISGFSPASGPGGTVVTITGTNFTGVNRVTINGMLALAPNVISSTQIRFTIPSLASTGVIVVSNPYWTVQTTTAFTVGGATVPTGTRGDSNGDGSVGAGDIFHLINFLFAGGPAPVGNADANSDGTVSAADVFFLINYLFANGPAPAASVPARTLSFETLSPVTLSLGAPVRRGGDVAVPVIVSGADVGGLALQLLVEGAAPADVKIVRAGASANLQPIFEAMPRGGNSVSYVGSFASIAAAQPVVVAEVVVSGGDRVVLSIDPETSAVAGANGSRVRTVGNDALVIGRASVEICVSCADRERVKQQ